MKEVSPVHRRLLAMVNEKLSDLQGRGFPLEHTSTPSELHESDALDEYVASLTREDLLKLRYQISLSALRQYNAQFKRLGR